jgi:hypothetical protein
MRRVNQLLKTLETGLGVDRLNQRDTADREKIIADLQARYDYLAGVPVQRESREGQTQAALTLSLSHCQSDRGPGRISQRE